MTFNGKTALVTGGSSGMGRICALRLAHAGIKVAILDVNEEGLAETAAQSNNIMPLRCDISDVQQVRACVAEAEAHLGPIDRLTHAAAIMPGRSVVDHSEEEVQRLFDINFHGTVNLVKTLLPSMMERGTAEQPCEIIAFGSVAGYAITPKLGVYCATKAAVNAYIEALQNELQHPGVVISLVCPPMTNTPLLDQATASNAITESRGKGRMADPEKVCDAIDRGVAKRKKRIFPGEARLLYLWHALLPSLWWKVVMGFEKD